MHNDTEHSHYVQTRLPTDLYEWLRLQAFLTRRSMNTLVIDALRAYRDTREAQPTDVPLAAGNEGVTR